jgi:D-serine dehydratase
VLELLGRVFAIATIARREKLFGKGPVILSAGGSAYFDLVAQRLKADKADKDTIVLIRSGCTLTHDDISYAKAFARLIERSPDVKPLGRLKPAIEIWGMVQSRPEAGLAYATVGKRDIAYDVDMPVPILWARPGVDKAPYRLEGHKVLRLNDQHAHLTLPAASPLQVGDLVGFGISHPCTTFDKWKVMLLADDDYRVTGAIRTYF